MSRQCFSPVSVFLVGTLLLTACSRPTRTMGISMSTAPTRFEREWRAYGKHPPQKALAVAGNLTGLYVSGVAFGDSSDVLAREQAFSNCEQRRADRRIEAACRIYAIGDTVLEGVLNAEK